MKILQNLGVIDRDTELPSRENTHALTSEEKEAIDEALGISEEITAARISLIDRKFQNVDKWYNDWNLNYKRIVDA